MNFVSNRRLLVKTQWKANIESSHGIARCCCEGERTLEIYSRKKSVESSYQMARSEWNGKITYDRHAPNLIPRQSGHLQLSLLEADGKRSGLTSSSWESNTGTESNAPFFPPQMLINPLSLRIDPCSGGSCPPSVVSSPSRSSVP